MREVIINLDYVIEYYGYLTTQILKEVIEVALSNKEDVVGFIFNDVQYTDTTDATLNKIVLDHKQWYKEVHDITNEPDDDVPCGITWVSDDGGEVEDEDFGRDIKRAILREKMRELDAQALDEPFREDEPDINKDTAFNSQFDDLPY